MFFHWIVVFESIYMEKTMIIPAEAGIQKKMLWIPAFAGMTTRDFAGSSCFGRFLQGHGSSPE